VGQVFSTYFNALAWLLPAVGVVLLLAFNGADGDIFTGICSVGNLQPDFFFRMIVFPQAVVIGGLLVV
jgi:hypothetical protein